MMLRGVSWFFLENRELRKLITKIHFMLTCNEQNFHKNTNSFEKGTFQHFFSTSNAFLHTDSVLRVFFKKKTIFH